MKDVRVIGWGVTTMTGVGSVFGFWFHRVRRRKRRSEITELLVKEVYNGVLRVGILTKSPSINVARAPKLLVATRVWDDNRDEFRGLVSARTFDDFSKFYALLREGEEVRADWDAAISNFGRAERRSAKLRESRAMEEGMQRFQALLLTIWQYGVTVMRRHGDGNLDQHFNLPERAEDWPQPA